MKIAIRTDASAGIGSGHVMRCLTLSDALAEKGASVFFIARELRGNMNAYIEARGYQVSRLQGDNVSGGDESFGVKVDAEQTAAVVQKNPVEMLVVDHYAVDRVWERMLRGYVGKIMVIDDLADREHDCDLLLNQNYYGQVDFRYDGLVPVHCKQLLGTRYTLLRPEFAAALPVLKPRTGKLEHILIFFGATDSQNQTLKALKAIRHIDRPEIEVDVIFGVNFPFKPLVLDFVAGMPEKVTCHEYVNNMAAMIAAADLYLGAAGTTTWERCCLGLPSVVIAVAANQIGPMERMDKAGIVRYLGESADVSVADVAAALRELLTTPSDLAEMSRKGMELVDGRGIQRCVMEIFNDGDIDEDAI